MKIFRCVLVLWSIVFGLKNNARWDLPLIFGAPYLLPVVILIIQTEYRPFSFEYSHYLFKFQDTELHTTQASCYILWP
jgi:hypothetical protein